MKKDTLSKSFDGKIQLTVSPQDSVAWKLSMLFEAAQSTSGTIKNIAEKYGYTRSYFYAVKKKYNEHGAEGLRENPKGPKKDYVRTDTVNKQIISHRFLDPEANCEVITQKMRQSGVKISQRSVERTIQDYGLQKKGYIKQIRKRQKKK